MFPTTGAAKKTSLLKENALQVASTTADLLGAGQLDRDGKGTVAILCNTLTLVSSAIEADVFICNLDGSVILCKDLFYARDAGSERKLLPNPRWDAFPQRGRAKNDSKGIYSCGHPRGRI
ncbi:MAG: hypothetical protein ACLVJ7_07250 [Acutalibacteraceae bacterium]